MSSETLLSPLPSSRVRHLTDAAMMFRQSLGDAALAYLEGRGIADQADGHGLGEVPQDVDIEWQPYRGMLAIPYWLPGGTCMAIKFRRMGDEKPKYLNTTGSTVPPYNVGVVAKATDTIVITEGEIEVITLSAMGIPAIGIAGSNAWKPHYARLIDGIPNVVIFGDPDDAGRKFNEEVQQSIQRAVPAYMERDINDTYVQDGILGAIAIQEAIKKAGGTA